MIEGRLMFKNQIFDHRNFYFRSLSLLHIILFFFFFGLPSVIGKTTNTKSVESLIAALKDDNRYVCAIAAESLGNIEDPRAIEPLIAALNENDLYIRKSVVDALIKIGKPAVEPLIAALKNKSRNVRSSAAKALGEIRDPRVVEPLKVALKDESHDVRRSAEIALGKIVDTFPVGFLIHALKDKKSDSSFRRFAARALGDIRDARATESLIAVLKGDDSFVRGTSAEALGKIGDKRGVIPLINALKDEFEYVRTRSAIALGQIGDSNAIEPLIDVFYTDNNQKVCGCAAIALVKLGDTRSFEILIGALKGSGQDARIRSVEALGQRSKIPSVTGLSAFLGSNDNGDDIRIRAAVALGQSGNTLALEPLITALKEGRGSVRSSAAKALGMIGSQQAVPTLVAALKDWYAGNQAANALQKFEWQPLSIEDNVHYAVAMRDKTTLIGMWEQAKGVLFEDIISNEYKTIENALYAFIAMGRQELIPELINTLNTKGNKTMAEGYLNCGQDVLEYAAMAWAVRNGYTINDFGTAPVRWGSW